MDTTGKWVIDPQFEGVAGFADSRAPVKVGGRIGYVDMTGKFVVNPQYDQGNEFNEGYASFANGGKWGFIDTGGKEVCAAKFWRLETSATDWRRRRRRWMGIHR